MNALYWRVRAFEADYTLLEVGLGGRYDATNVIAKPALTVITPVSIDHTQFLGNTVTEIAGEKAGIIKRGVPVIIGQQNDEAQSVIETTADNLHAPMLAYGQQWRVWEERGRLIYEDEHGLRDLPLPNLVGEHQVKNAGMAVAALRALDHSDDALEGAVTNANWPARMQRLKEGPLVALADTAELWLDGGHNPAAGAAIKESLSRLTERPTYAICGMLNTKDISGYLTPLKAAGIKALHGVSIPGEAATLSAQETVEAAKGVGLSAFAQPNLEAALRAILEVEPYARVLICGSLYLAGHVLRENS